ncbi:transcription factor E2F8 isoform X1 [Pygocentrus nattereri]|uniref:Transcription factor E2F8 n=2 Tax=Pygocentrus nattereri TaxID=42514 RepID=A0A3B4D502_PYGNA|nr:transcription factor E2F8 isoform X1 [Pygocentrus nattereri]
MLSPRLYYAVKKRWKMSSALLDGQKLLRSPKRSTSANEKKKALFVEPQTPVKPSGKSAAPLETQKSMGPLTTPTKGPDAPAGEPWTPTSNLKMLISAASPEIRNREKERSTDGAKAEEAECSSQEPEGGEESEKLQLSRKEKSLGLLCHKFLARYPDYPNPAVNNDICLDDVAAELNVERRRIYDIMNVLESLHMVSRLAKNRYTWHGRAKLAETLAALHRAGEENRYSQQMQQLRQKNLEQEFELDGEEKENEEDGDGQKELSFSETSGDTKTGSSRKDKSLRVMSQKFVMLFLVSCPRVVSLEVAAKILIGEDQVVDQDKSKFKTKIRRLYDIANVLSSLELIKKVHVTEDRGRKPAFKWTGPEDLPLPQDVEVAKATPASLLSRPLESRASLDNCTKNLFCSPGGGKRGFTRHHSLVKLAKSIQDDRRKINSAPASPIKMTSETVSGGLAHLAAICKMQLDEETVGVHRQPDPEDATEVYEETSLPCAASSEAESASACSKGVHFPVVPTGAVSYLPSHCSSLIPVLLPQPQVGRSYALYVHHASVRPHPSTRPPPTSLAVRSMTFESPGGPNTKASPVAMAAAGQTAQALGHDPASPSLKRACAEMGLEGSPSKVKRAEVNSKSSSPKLGEILQARLKARRGALKSNRPSSRALHLDPEFTKPPEPRSAPLEHSLENFLEKEEKLQPESSETGLTPTQLAQTHLQTNIPAGQETQTGHVQAETLIPTGYLIPIPQQPLLSFKETQSSCEAPKASTPTYNIYHTPTAGSRPPPPQEFTPTSLHLPRVPPLSPFSPSPSPAILNFTLQNMGLITSPSTPAPSGMALEHPSPNIPPGMSPHGMIFVKPVSPAGALPHAALHGQPVTFISLQQPLLTTPKGGPAVQHSFFHTPVSSLPTMTTPTAPKSIYIPQRKLDVSSEDS